MPDESDKFAEDVKRMKDWIRPFADAVRNQIPAKPDEEPEDDDENEEDNENDERKDESREQIREKVRSLVLKEIGDIDFSQLYDDEYGLNDDNRELVADFVLEFWRRIKEEIEG